MFNWLGPHSKATRVGAYSFVANEASLLGKGTYASVYRGHHSATKDVVAVKVVDLHNRSKLDMHYLEQEVRLMSNTAHPNIVRLLEVYVRFALRFFCICFDLLSLRAASRARVTSPIVLKVFRWLSVLAIFLRLIPSHLSNFVFNKLF